MNFLYNINLVFFMCLIHGREFETFVWADWNYDLIKQMSDILFNDVKQCTNTKVAPNGQSNIKAKTKKVVVFRYHHHRKK